MTTEPLESLRRVALIALCMLCAPVLAQPRVNVDNFKRAETDNYFSKFVQDNGKVGSFRHSPRGGTDRQAGRDPHESRHAVLVGSCRPRRVAGDRDAARRRQALHGDAGDQRRPLHDRA